MSNAERPPSAQDADYGKVVGLCPTPRQGFRPLDDDQLRPAGPAQSPHCDRTVTLCLDNKRDLDIPKITQILLSGPRGRGEGGI